MAVLSFSVGADEKKPDRPLTEKEVVQAGRQMRADVEAVVGALDGNVRASAAQGHDDATIRKISLFPGRRNGARLGDMSDSQRRQVERLLQSVLTEDAYERACKVFKQDSGTGDYYFTRFWDGGATDPLAWRLEGHHFSVTFFVDDKHRIRPGTLLIGGRNDVWKPLDDQVRALCDALTEDLRAQATLTQPPRRTGNPPHEETLTRPGLAWKDLDAQQRKKLTALLDAFQKMFHKPVVNLASKSFSQAGGKPSLHIAFSGSPEMPDSEYHFSLRGAHGLNIEFDTRDGHTHMLIHLSAGKNDSETKETNKPDSAKS